MAAANAKNIFLVPFISGLYLLLAYLFIGFRTDQLFLAVLFNTLYFISPSTRQFALGFAAIAIYWIIFDFMKAFPNYRFAPVHLESLYNAEKYLFGFEYNGSRVTANEFFKFNISAFADVMAGIFYLCWIPVPILFGTYLFFKNKKLFFQFTYTFLLMNLIGFVVYYVYPAAPPWYLQEHGSTFISTTPSGIAGLAGFDHYFNITLFKSMYSKGSNVFAAMPSMHSADPLLVAYYSRKTTLPAIVKFILIIITAGIWWTAVYTSHHYILDVLAGILCAVTAIALFTYWQRYTWMQIFLQKLILTGRSARA